MDVRVVKVEYCDEPAPADEWIQRLIERLLLVKLDLSPEDAGNFLHATDSGREM
jgi:hypothetical protein